MTPYGQRTEEREVLNTIAFLRQTEGLSLQKVADHLNSQRIPTKCGKAWNKYLLLNVEKRKSNG
jgi:hypothetical protein